MAFVTGMGMITALGTNVAENLNSLLSEKDGLRLPKILDTKHKNSIVVGEVPLNNYQLAEQLFLDTKGYSRTTLLGIHALKEAIENAGLSKDDLKNNRIAFINATTVGGMSEVENLYADMASDATEGAFMDYIDAVDCADCTFRIASYFGLKGFTATVSTACSSAANALQMGARMIQAGEVDIAICGGTDALTKFTINGFNALKNVDKEPCRPFDEYRNGINLGEAAAYLVLESQKSISKRAVTPIAILAGHGNTNEAHHPTAPSPDGSGAARTMRAALAHTAIDERAIDYINAHGTATQGNDLSEGMAIRSVFGDGYPPFSSTKSFTGHTLAASGAVEAIFSCLAIIHQFIPSNLRFTSAMSETGLEPIVSTQHNRPLNFVLSNSFGFGGNNVSLIFKKNTID
jgi:3-oxoacyl-(acyl-carrier-protein) synthase